MRSRDKGTLRAHNMPYFYHIYGTVIPSVILTPGTPTCAIRYVIIIKL